MLCYRCNEIDPAKFSGRKKDRMLCRSCRDKQEHVCRGSKGLDLATQLCTDLRHYLHKRGGGEVGFWRLADIEKLVKEFIETSEKTYDYKKYKLRIRHVNKFMLFLPNNAEIVATKR